MFAPDAIYSVSLIYAEFALFVEMDNIEP